MDAGPRRGHVCGNGGGVSGLRLATDEPGGADCLHIFADGQQLRVGDDAFANPLGPTASPWATQEAANASAAASYNDQALLAWLGSQNTTLAANSQAEASTAQAARLLADQTAAATLAQTLSGAATALAAARVTAAGNLATAQAGNSTSSVPLPPVAPFSKPATYTMPVMPGSDPAYVIALPSAADYDMSVSASDPSESNVAYAHNSLVADGYADPWSGWWNGNTPSVWKLYPGSYNPSAPFPAQPYFTGTPYFDGVAHERLEGAMYSPGTMLDGTWHGGWSDGAAQAVFETGLSVVDPNSTAFKTYVAALATPPQSSPVQTISFIVGMGVGFLTAECGPIISGGASMAAMNATSAFLTGVLAGHSAEDIVYDTLEAGVKGAAAGLAGAEAASILNPITTGLASALGLTCSNGLGVSARLSSAPAMARPSASPAPLPKSQ